MARGVRSAKIEGSGLDEPPKLILEALCRAVGLVPESVQGGQGLLLEVSRSCPVLSAFKPRSEPADGSWSQELQASRREP